MSKTFKIKAPIGTSVVPNETMNEDQLRNHALQLLQEKDEIWAEKITKDPIEDIVDWLRNLEYKIEEVK